MRRHLLIDLLFLIPAVYCLVMVFMSYIDIIRAKRTHSWPSTTAIIDGIDFSSSTYRQSRSVNTSTSYVLEFSYTYKVDGQEYVGNRLSFIGDFFSRTKSYSFSTRAERDEVRSRYIPDKYATVYYHPNRPYVSVLIKGAPKDLYPEFTWILLFLGIALVYLFVRPWLDEDDTKQTILYPLLVSAFFLVLQCVMYLMLDP